MKIKSLMVKNPITIPPDASIESAIEIMQSNSIRHLPVVLSDGSLKGFVTLADMREGLIPAMIGEISLRDLMIRKPITVAPDDDVETAARRIYNHKISGMPVVQNGQLVGIVTETDILRTFIDMMGILTSSSRMEVEMDENPATFVHALEIIQDNGAEIINVSITAREENRRIYSFRLTRCDVAGIQAALEKEGFTLTETVA